jgi:hypothetical protein
MDSALQWFAPIPSQRRGVQKFHATVPWDPPLSGIHPPQNSLEAIC